MLSVFIVVGNTTLAGMLLHFLFSITPLFALTSCPSLYHSSSSSYILSFLSSCLLPSHYPLLPLTHLTLFLLSFSSLARPSLALSFLSLLLPLLALFSPLTLLSCCILSLSLSPFSFHSVSACSSSVSPLTFLSLSCSNLCVVLS